MQECIVSDWVTVDTCQGMILIYLKTDVNVLYFINSSLPRLIHKFNIDLQNEISTKLSRSVDYFHYILNDCVHFVFKLYNMYR